MADDSDPFAIYEEYKKQHDLMSSRAGQIPTAEQRDQKASQRQIQASAAAAFGNIGPLRRGVAGARHVVGSMPLIRHIPGVSGFANPEEGTQEREDLENYRIGQPGSATFGRILGGSVPYLGAAGLAPRLLSSFPYAAGANASIAGGEEYLSGGNPASGAITGALSTIPGWALSRALTPRSNAAAGATMGAYNDAVTDAQAGALRAAAAALGGMSGRGSRGRFVPRISSDEAKRIMEEAQRRLHQARYPSPRIGEIGTGKNNRTARAIENAMQQAMMGMLGAGVGLHQGINPAFMGVAGMVVPPAIRATMRGVNAGINSVNERLLSGRLPRLARMPLFRYLNNQALPDDARSVLMALGVPATEEAAPMVGEALQGIAFPPRDIPTLGGQ